MEDGHARTQGRLGLANGISAHQLRGNLTKLQRHAGRQLYPYVVFVRDVDTQYAGMVKARKENFAEQGLTEQTHYISSTGIGGLPADTRALVQMGTYALTGFEPSTQQLPVRSHPP